MESLPQPSLTTCSLEKVSQERQVEREPGRVASLSAVPGLGPKTPTAPPGKPLRTLLRDPHPLGPASSAEVARIRAQMETCAPPWLPCGHRTGPDGGAMWVQGVTSSSAVQQRGPEISAPTPPELWVRSRPRLVRGPALLNGLHAVSSECLGLRLQACLTVTHLPALQLVTVRATQGGQRSPFVSCEEAPTAAPSVPQEVRGRCSGPFTGLQPFPPHGVQGLATVPSVSVLSQRRVPAGCGGQQTGWAKDLLSARSGVCASVEPRSPELPPLVAQDGRKLGWPCVPGPLSHFEEVTCTQGCLLAPYSVSGGPWTPDTALGKQVPNQQVGLGKGAPTSGDTEEIRGAVAACPECCRFGERAWAPGWGMGWLLCAGGGGTGWIWRAGEGLAAQL